MKISKLFLAICLITISFLTQAQVGIGTNSPAATAQLEVSSTSKGFLPPRMTYAQREAITNPATGLMIYCSNCGSNGELQVYNGSAWTNLVGGSASAVPSTIAIGSNYGGGIVAYILQDGDPGYDAAVQHGLISATVSQSTGFIWNNNYVSTTTGATGTAIGTGLANTNSIIASQGADATSYAAGLARAYNGGGYTDWYLPSKDELVKLHAMKQLGYGGFLESYYWSSTEVNLNVAWSMGFYAGDQLGVNKNTQYYVCAVRSF